MSREPSDEKQNGGPFVILLQFESVHLNVAIPNPFPVCEHPNFIKKLFQQGSRIMFNSKTFHTFEISRATVVIISIRDTNDLKWQIGITKQNRNYSTVIPTNHLQTMFSPIIPTRNSILMPLICARNDDSGRGYITTTHKHFYKHATKKI